MSENKQNKPLTLDDLAKFSEDVLLPAVENIFDEKLKPTNSRLDSIEQRLDSIELNIKTFRKKIDAVEERLKKIEKTSNEDVDALSFDVEKLKAKAIEFERQIKLLQQQQGV